MSGDVSLENEPVIFYSPDMTVTKMIVLKHKGIKFKLYSKVIKKIDDFSFDKTPQDDDLRQDNILIDKTSADLLKGSEVDYVSELIGDSFKITNPQSKSSCGCGVSFSL